MKYIFYTQRVDIVQSYQERRDASDQRIAAFLSATGFQALPLPNRVEIVEDLFAEEEGVLPAGFFFTGGNNLEKYGGSAPERDAMERKLLSVAINHRLPVFGICRGMQLILDYFGGALVPVSGHVRERHSVLGKIKRMEVNSYHTLGAQEVPGEICVAGRAPDGTIEAICHKRERVFGIGWHPEREASFSPEDVALVRGFFLGGEL